MEKGKFIDPRDGKVYKTVKIGEQVWMAQNLNYEAEGSVCYNNDPANGEKYGRLYGWETAKKSCPAGWHIPNYGEWQILVDFAGGKETAGKKLKAKRGWEVKANGTDDYGFAALPGGCGFDDIDTYAVISVGKGNSAEWWSAEHSRTIGIYEDGLIHHAEDDDGVFQSVRCVRD